MKYAIKQIVKETRLRKEDLEGLPESLLKELSQSSKILKEGKTIFDLVLEVFEELDGVASLDQVIVGLYRKTNSVYTREDITRRVYKLTRAKVISPVEGVKGIYCLEGVYRSGKENRLKK